MRNDLELLAPVGSFDSLVAAIQNGANAVYLGGKEFSARASANNFDREELKDAVEYAHIRGCKVFVTVNTLIKESEKDNFLEYIGYMYSIMVDAIILQDIGMASIIKAKYPNFELHASTQMAAHSLNDVLHLKKAGFKRVVLARELNIDEIKNICANTDVDIEIFVHGALCVCYSGQCLMSSVMGTRSGNRGRCAQPCRQSYKLYNSDENSYVETDGSYLLSPRDLNTVENLDKIIETGVLSLKIEGRMKKPEYVASVVGTYKEAINQYLESGKINLEKEKIDNLYTIFNRKFTNGYILGEIGSENMNADKPNNRGLYIGKVISYNSKKKRLKIKLEKPLRKGDGLNIGGGTVGRIIIGNNIVDYADGGKVVEIDYIGRISNNTEIYKTSDSRLNSMLQESFNKNKELVKIPLSFYLEISLGKCTILKILDIDGNSVEVYGEKEAEQAIKVPLTYDKVKTQISKLGDTPYILDDLTLNLEEGVSLPISELNNLRRIGIDIISSKRIEIKDRNIEQLSELTSDIDIYSSKLVKNDIINNEITYPNNSKNRIVKENIKKITYNVSCNNLKQLDVILNYDIGKIYYRDIYSLEEAIEIANKKGRKISYYFPRIIRNEEKEIYNRLLNLSPEKISCLESFRISNFGQIEFIKENFQIDIDVSSWLNVLNYESIKYFSGFGAKNICFSQEASLEQVKKIISDMNIENIGNLASLEYLVYGNVEMMVSEYCPMGVLTKDCKRNKRDAVCRKSIYYLESKEGEKFRLSQDMNCRTTIYSSEKVNLYEYLEQLIKVGVNSFEISLYFEDEKDTSIIMNMYINEEVSLNNKTDVYSTGHLFKEID